MLCTQRLHAELASTPPSSPLLWPLPCSCSGDPAALLLLCASSAWHRLQKCLAHAGSIELAHVQCIPGTASQASPWLVGSPAKPACLAACLLLLIRIRGQGSCHSSTAHIALVVPPKASGVYVHRFPQPCRPPSPSSGMKSCSWQAWLPSLPRDGSKVLRTDAGVLYATLLHGLLVLCERVSMAFMSCAHMCP